MSRDEMIQLAAKALESAPCTCPGGLNQYGAWRKVSPDCPRCGDSHALATVAVDAILGGFWAGGEDG